MKSLIYKYTLLPVILVIGICFAADAADPTSTSYPAADCDGSLTPYRIPDSQVIAPDSLTPVFINHVGRHGARYPAGSAHTMKLLSLLNRADTLGTITPLGRKLLKITREVAAVSNGRWGALDSLGMAEQRGIAARMYLNFPTLFSGGCVINAISSYSPRCMMSMFSFVHELDRMNSNIFVITSTGKQNSALMRPFDVNTEYLDWRKSGAWEKPYNEYADSKITLAPLKRVLGEKYPMTLNSESREWAIVEYYVIAGLNAMSYKANPLEFFTLEEYNIFWSCFNLRQYLQRCASTLSAVPAEIAAPLLSNLITTTDDFIRGTSTDRVQLRFGHAETLMPLLSLMRIPGCYYMTNYFDTVALHWKDFFVVPMAANLQMILFRAPSGKYYLRTDLNENPVKLIPGSDDIYIPWEKARSFLEKCAGVY